MTHNIHYESYRVKRLNESNANGLALSPLTFENGTLEKTDAESHLWTRRSPHCFQTGRWCARSILPRRNGTGERSTFGPLMENSHVWLKTFLLWACKPVFLKWIYFGKGCRPEKVDVLWVEPGFYFLSLEIFLTLQVFFASRSVEWMARRVGRLKKRVRLHAWYATGKSHNPYLHMIHWTSNVTCTFCSLIPLLDFLQRNMNLF